ncbi:MAG: hypothetical protein B7X34_00880 [Acidobacteriia bacterium 12-62-4]|nr:MAG: hypothetical protein B7X34_00880 [Acidobacteriia bacterium 12-62-4]
MPWSAANEFDAYVKKAEAQSVMAAGATIEVKGGLIHDWSAEAFVKDRTPEQVIAVLQSYERYREIYPEVTASRLLSKEGNRFRAALQLKRKKFLTVILNTEYDVEYQKVDEGRWRVVSRSTKVEEADGGDNGFLWRLNAYWVISAEPGGVRLQCRSVSLSRDVPLGLSWAVKPLLREMPQESLAGMLSATVKALR